MMTNEEIKNEILLRVQAVEKIKRKRTRIVCTCISSTMCLAAIMVVILHSFVNHERFTQLEPVENVQNESVPYAAEDIEIRPFDAPVLDPDYDYWVGDEITQVSVVLDGVIKYLQVDIHDYSKYGFKTELTKSDFGAFIGTVEETGGECADIPVGSQDPSLKGACVYYYRPVGCRAAIIVKSAERCSIFLFHNFTGDDEIHSISETYEIYGVQSERDINHLTYRVSGSVGTDYQIIESGEVTNPQKIKDFYDVTRSLVPQKAASSFAATPDWLNQAYEEYSENPEKYKQEDILIEIHLKNGLVIFDIYYQPYIANGHVSSMEELTPEQNTMLRNALSAD